MITRTLLFPILTAGLAAGWSLAAAVEIQGPVLGYYGSAEGRTLRPIAGIAGSATLGPVLTTGLDAVWVAPDNRTALGLRQGMIYLVQDIRNATGRLPLGPWNGGLSSVFWAGDSSGAVLYSADRQVLQTATRLTANPAMGPEIDLTSLGGPLVSVRFSGSPWTTALIVRRAGTNLSRRSASRGLENATDVLYLLPALGAPVLVKGISRPGAMDFSADARNLYVVDQTSNRLAQVDVSAPEKVNAVAINSPELAPVNFSALAVSSDGGRILLLDKKRQSACAIDTKSGDTAFCSDLDFSPAGMRRLSGSLYLLDSGTDPTVPLWILDSDLGRSFFVPVGGQR